MDLYRSTKANLHSKPSYPNSSNSGWQFLHLIFFCQSKWVSPFIQNLWRPPSLRGCPAMQTYCHCWQPLVTVWQKKRSKTHFTSWSKCPAAEVACENKWLRRKAQGNEMSRISQTETRAALGNRGSLEKAEGLNGQLILQELKGTAVFCNADNRWLNHCLLA